MALRGMLEAPQSGTWHIKPYIAKAFRMDGRMPEWMGNRSRAHVTGE